jgi:hypothetical protein
MVKSLELKIKEVAVHAGHFQQMLPLKVPSYLLEQL